MTSMISIERIETKIFNVRGQKVMLDRDLAELYGVETRVLNQAVKRNIERFPEDFMFQLTRGEIRDLSQIVTSSKIKHAPKVSVFTEHGILMLSSVLKSKQAVAVNIQIMRVFTKFRNLINNYGDLKRKIEQMEQKYDSQFQIVFKAVKELINKEKQVPKKRRIGFDAEK